MNVEPGEPETTRGLLHRRASETRYDLLRQAPAPALAEHVDCYWRVRWDLRGAPDHRQETLPHPCVHVTVEAERAAVYGLVTTRFERVLAGRGRVFGIKFRPGGFHPFWVRPLSELTGCVLPIGDVFGEAGEAYAAAVLATEDDDELRTLADAFLLARTPARDARVAQVTELVERMQRDPTLTRVEPLLEGSALSLRSLQRMFAEYVGASPKAVLQRYRLHEALERIDASSPESWAQLALELGYADQAHFIREFKRFVGRPPARYAGERPGAPE